MMHLSLEEVMALRALLERVPMTSPEHLWAQSILDRLLMAAQLPVEAQQQPQNGKEEEEVYTNAGSN